MGDSTHRERFTLRQKCSILVSIDECIYFLVFIIFRKCLWLTANENSYGFFRKALSSWNFAIKARFVVCNTNNGPVERFCHLICGSSQLRQLAQAYCLLLWLMLYLRGLVGLVVVLFWFAWAFVVFYLCSAKWFNSAPFDVLIIGIFLIVPR